MEPQRFGFLGRQLKHEVFGKPLGIAFHRLVEVEGLYLVQLRQIGVEHYALAADHIDLVRDGFYGHGRRGTGLVGHRIERSW